MDKSPLDPPRSAEDRLLAALAYPFWYLAFPIFLLAPSFQQRPFLKLAEWVAFLTTVYAAIGAWLGNRTELPYITEFVRPLLHEGPKGNSPE